MSNPAVTPMMCALCRFALMLPQCLSCSGDDVTVYRRSALPPVHHETRVDSTRHTGGLKPASSSGRSRARLSPLLLSIRPCVITTSTTWQYDAGPGKNGGCPMFAATITPQEPFRRPHRTTSTSQRRCDHCGYEALRSHPGYPGFLASREAVSGISTSSVDHGSVAHSPLLKHRSLRPTSTSDVRHSRSGGCQSPVLTNSPICQLPA